MIGTMRFAYWHPTCCASMLSISRQRPTATALIAHYRHAQIFAFFAGLLQRFSL